MRDIDFIQDFAAVLLVAAAAAWACRRLRIPAIAGFLVAGLATGPAGLPASLVEDPAHVDLFMQVGLVFLMFSIGLRLSVGRLGRLGLGVPAAVVTAAAAVFYLAQILGAFAGLAGLQATFIAVIVMVSSVSMVYRLVNDSPAAHERAGQLAVGLSQTEALLAVVLLAVLSAVGSPGFAGRASGYGRTLGEIGAFVAVAGVLGLLLVPWLLRRVGRAAASELSTLLVGGLLFGLASVADVVGYSPALGALLLGMIVAETRHRAGIERSFDGMRDLFSAVFFVAVGMQSGPGLIAANAEGVLVLTVFALVARGLVVPAALAVMGTPPREALRVGVLALPIGEFSFILANVGMASLLLPASAGPVVTGTAVLTGLIAALLQPRAARVADALLRVQPRWLRDWNESYVGWIERLQARPRRSLLWRLSRRRVIQIGLGMLVVTGLLVFAGPLLTAVEERVGEDFAFPRAVTLAFWLLVALTVLLPLVAIWRNLSAMALLYAQVVTQGLPRSGKRARAVEAAMKLVAGVGLALWLSTLLPMSWTNRWLVVASLAAALMAVLLLRRKLIRWHSELEVGLEDTLAEADRREAALQPPRWGEHEAWNLRLVDCVLPDLAHCRGQTLGELDLPRRFGCTVVGIERQGHVIGLPSAGMGLYPRDRLLMLGSPKDLAAGRDYLQAIGDEGGDRGFEDVRLEVLRVPMGSPAEGCPLDSLPNAAGRMIRVVGIERAGLRLLAPAPEDVLRSGDRLLVLGSPRALAELRVWLEEPPAAGTAGPASE
jgi:monovalent cation:H+ antiporter-2, CPA2 family